MEKNFVPDIEWMARKYDELNASLFEGRLGACDFNVFTTGRGSGGGVLGWFKITGTSIFINRSNRRLFHENYYIKNEYVNYDNFVDLCRPLIELNGNYRGTEHGFLYTLVHEMCHYYTYMYGWAPTQAHGREFRNIGSIVSSRSNGLFTVQRIASAEQMSELELNDEMKAKKQKRLENKKASVSAVVAFEPNGRVRLTMTSNQVLINKIKNQAEKAGDAVFVSNDSDVIDFLFSKGFKKNMRTWRYWLIESAPWLDELKTLLNYNGNKTEKETPINNIEPEPEKETPKKIFYVKTNNGTFECNADSKENLINSIKKQFPKMNDETIERIINNPANYRLNENKAKKNIRQIINEVIDEFIETEGLNNEDVENSVEINPNMNLGLVSPLQN